ncbi:hypothetical protein [Rhodococcus tibetensis]|uniref:hypothetical protein n=1 Tax=Rhodococcus tibetensis TaxID=2965064 RepID=UPI0035AB7F4F
MTVKDKLVLLGRRGTGQTSGDQACDQRLSGGRGCCSRPPAPWGSRLADADHTGRLETELIKLDRHPLLVVDEVGHISFDTERRRTCGHFPAGRARGISLPSSRVATKATAA